MVDVGAAFPADREAAVLMQQGKGLFDSISGSPGPNSVTAMLRRALAHLPCLEISRGRWGMRLSDEHQPMSSRLPSRFRRTATSDHPGSRIPTAASLLVRKNST